MFPKRCLASLLICHLLVGFAGAEEKAVSFWEQKESVQALIFTPDGKSLITAGGNLQTGHVAFWDLDKMTRTIRIDGIGMVNALAITADGNTLVVHETKYLGGRATLGAVHVWDIATRKKRFQVPIAEGHTFLSRAMAVSPDGKRLALSHEGGEITLHDLATGRPTAGLPGKATIWGLAFSKDGQRLASANEGGVSLFDALTPKHLKDCEIARGKAVSLAFAPDGKSIAVGVGREFDDPGEVVWLDVATGQERARWKGHAGPVMSVHFSSDGKRLVSGARSSDIILWDAVTGTKALELAGPLNLNEVAFSSDGKMLAVAGGTGDFIISSGGVRLWDLPAGRERLHPKAAAERDRREKAHAQTALEQAAARARRDRDGAATANDRVRRAEYALKIFQARERAGRWEFVRARALLDELLPAKEQTDLRGLEWHLLDARLPRTISLDDDVHSAAISPDGATLALAVKDKVDLTDAATGKRRFTLDGFTHSPGEIIFSPDGSLVAVADHTYNADKSDVKVFKVGTGKEVVTLTRHVDGVECLAFSPDGGLLAAGGRGNRVIVWETKTWKIVSEMEDFKWIVGSVAFSPDAKLLATGIVFNALQVRDVASGKELFEPGPSHKRLAENGLLFLPDGKNLIAVGERGLVEIKAATGRRIRVFGKQSAGNPLVLTPDGRKLVAGWSLFDLATGDELATFEQGSTADRLPKKHERLLALAVTPAAQVRMVIAGRDGARHVSFPLQQRPQQMTSGADHLMSVNFSADGSALLAATHRNIVRKEQGSNIVVGSVPFVERWDATMGAVKLRAQATDTEGIALAFDSEKGAMATAGGVHLSLTDLAAVRSWVTLTASEERVQIDGIAPDGSVVAFYHESRSANSGKTLHDGKTGAQLAKLKGDFGFDGRLRFTADSQSVLTWEDDLVLWNAKTGQERKRWELPGYCRALGLTVDGKEPAAALLHERKGDNCFLWNVQLGERISLIRRQGYMHSAVFSPDGQVLATDDYDGTIRLWDAVTGHPRARRGHPFGLPHLAFRPDGRALAAGNFEGTISLWAVRAK